ncbi:fumarylacetoacetate hydrolase family protein [Ramlibacter sp.]|uniref:fumarylacetoacetate hydrolase family protein n=1 Tax=Ramlibacter sp. TaxID=1917967 RepID=UPI003D0BF772
MSRWIRFRRGITTAFGRLDEETVQVHRGDMFAGAEPTGERVALADVELLAPCEPSKMLGMWRNFKALGAAMHLPDPVEPLYFIKAGTSFLAPGGTIRRPRRFDGTVVFEGELGIVIGREASGVDEAEATRCIFGYTCVNDVTGMEPLQDKVFPHWTRAKGFDTFGPFGPCIETEFDWRNATVRTILNGTERQNYRLDDMVMPPAELVSRISFDMTLRPGDVIACGTSIGVGRLKPGCSITIDIEGIGALTNTYVAES